MRLFDRRLSRDESIFSASCHDPKFAFSEGRPVAVGVRGLTGVGSAPALINRAYGRLFFWDGRARSLEEQGLQPVQNPVEMDMTLRQSSAATAVF
jgi:cytochrome c peroxidase